MQTAEGDSPGRAARIRRRDRHGRGLRGVLAPPGVPLYRTRTERFDDLVLQAVARLEPQWEAHLSGVEFAVEEIPPLEEAMGGTRGPVPLSRLEPGSPRSLRLGLIMAIGTIGGAEIGAQLIEAFKRAGNVNFVVSIVSIVIYLGISTFMIWESSKTLARTKRSLPQKSSGSGPKADVSAFQHTTEAIQRWRIPPMISLPASGVTMSLWIILLVAFVGGICSGFLGGGAGYIRMPPMLYVLGIPTHLAVGTDLFEIIISASYGTFTHAIKGNVDILIALVMHTGAAVGAQIGALLTQYFAGPKIRLAFVPLPLIGAAIVIYTMVTGHKL